MAYVSLLGVEKGGNMLLLLPAVLLIGGGVFLLFKAGQMEGTKPKFNDVVLPEVGKETVIDKNNKLAAEWNQTNTTRDKLRMVQAAAVASTEESTGN